MKVPATPVYTYVYAYGAGTGTGVGAIVVESPSSVGKQASGRVEQLARTREKGGESPLWPSPTGAYSNLVPSWVPL